MPKDRETRQTVEFIRGWFDWDPPSKIRTSYRIALCNITDPRPSTVCLEPPQWLSILDNVEFNFATMLEAFHGKVKIFPHFVLTPSENTSTGLLTEETIHVKSLASVGHWVDLPGSIYTDQIISFADYLRDEWNIEPTLITGRDMDGSLPYFDQGRMWWRAEWDKPPKSTITGSGERVAWQMAIQHHAENFGLCNGLPIVGIPTFTSSLYTLPGTEGVSVLSASDARVSQHQVEIASSRPMAEMKEARTQLMTAMIGPGIADIAALTWDDILVPQGWRSRGMGRTIHENWWSAPGSGNEMTAVTDEYQLHLHAPNWLSGLKEASDVGVTLHKWMVACLLGWDGDADSMTQHWIDTGRIY